MSIFKTYDIRGVFGEDLSKENCINISKAIASYCVKKGYKHIVCGKDARLSSDFIHENLILELKNVGLIVDDIGLVTTPVFNYSIVALKSDFGVMITASHNPKEYNGFKMCTSGPLPLYYENGIAEIQTIYQNLGFCKPLEDGKVTKVEIIPAYAKYISSLFKAITIPFVADCSNGPSGLVMDAVSEFVGIHPILINKEPDGNFPNHPPNPLEKENLSQLSEKVKAEKVAFGICFDGDGDRAFFVDETGEPICLDVIFSILLKSELLRNPGQEIYYDLRFSKIVEKAILAYHGVPIKLRVGNPFYKEKLINTGGVLAGELSGHIMYANNYSIDDSIYALMKLLEILKTEKKPLSKLCEEFNDFNKSDEINLKVDDPNKVFEKIKTHYSYSRIEQIDGISVYSEGFWFNIRKSNTEPLVRLNLEADSKKMLELKIAEVKKLILD